MAYERPKIRFTKDTVYIDIEVAPGIPQAIWFEDEEILGLKWWVKETNIEVRTKSGEFTIYRATSPEESRVVRHHYE